MEPEKVRQFIPEAARLSSRVAFVRHRRVPAGFSLTLFLRAESLYSHPPAFRRLDPRLQLSRHPGYQQAAECANSSMLMRASAVEKVRSACSTAGITTLLSSAD
jgi:hypothetical protein